VRPGPQLTAHDAVETAILAALARANQKIAPMAWLDIRQAVRELTMAGEDDIWIALSETGFSHRAVVGGAGVAKVAADTGEAYRIVCVRDRIVAARERFDAESERVRGSSAVRRRAAKGGRA
jgi:hypothetical protein